MGAADKILAIGPARFAIRPAILLAAADKLPLASVCLWLTYHSQQVAERRIVLLLRRQRRASRG